MTFLLVGTRVTIDGKERGTVLGYATWQRHGKVHPGYIVELDNGAWLRSDEYRDRFFVSTVVAHFESVTELDA